MKKPEDFTNGTEKLNYMIANNLVEIESKKGNYFMDADDFYLGGEHND